MTKVQILMATYNGEKYLEEQIESILNQTYKDWELLIRDDGSTDNTNKIINSYSERAPGKIIRVNDELGNLGCGQNFMQLLLASNENYIMFSDQDDIWKPDKVFKFMNKMIEMENRYSSNTPILIHSDLEIVDSENNTISNSFYKFRKMAPERFTTLNKLLVKNYPGCSTIINKPLKKLALEYSLSLNKYIMLHDLWLFLIASIFGKVCYFEEATMRYRLHSGNTVGFGKKEGQFEKNIFKIIMNFQKKRNTFYNDEKLRHRFASLILDNYSEILNQESKNILINFNNILTSSFFKKKYIIIKYNFLEDSLLMNIRRLLYY